MQDQFYSLVERATPYVQRIARRLVRAQLAAGDAVGDVENNMWTLVLPRLRTYDQRRGTVAHFIVVVIGSAGRSLRQHYSRRRMRRHVSINAPVAGVNGDGNAEASERLLDQRGERRRRACMRIDAGMDGAPPHLWEVFHAMEDGSARAAAKGAKLSRKKTGHAIEAIRLRLSG